MYREKIEAYIDAHRQEMLEDIWGEYQVYSGDELNPVSTSIRRTP